MRPAQPRWSPPVRSCLVTRRPARSPHRARQIPPCWTAPPPEAPPRADCAASGDACSDPATSPRGTKLPVTGMATGMTTKATRAKTRRRTPCSRTTASKSGSPGSTTTSQSALPSLRRICTADELRLVATHRDLALNPLGSREQSKDWMCVFQRTGSTCNRKLAQKSSTLSTSRSMESVVSSMRLSMMHEESVSHLDPLPRHSLLRTLIATRLTRRAFVLPIPHEPSRLRPCHTKSLLRSTLDMFRMPTH
mmetsp:Transcript_16937/g.50649  ORF Transcript_16937/g.50649 Transcript_16937/m.50649 type:complete len:250 (-) Transcript_16937:299-1048(-)